LTELIIKKMLLKTVIDSGENSIINNQYSMLDDDIERR